MANFPGEYQVEITYIVGIIEHKMSLNCDVVGGFVVPGTDPVNIDLQTKGGSSVQLAIAVPAFVNLLKKLWHDDCSFVDYTFWRFDVGTYDRNFIATGSLAIDGDSASENNIAHQQTLTFRTVGGGILKLVLLESIFAGNLKQSLPAASNADTVALRDFVLSDNNWIIARDNTYPVAALRLLGGQNEKLFRKRYRS